MHGWNIHSMKRRKKSHEELASQPVGAAGSTGRYVALIAVAATAGLNSLAGSINAAFVSIGTDSTTAVA
jgi:hypothetical protein